MLVCNCANPDCMANGCLRARQTAPPYVNDYVTPFKEVIITQTTKGWECPRCQKIWSPATKECEKCNG